jgi:hypothetical protein
MQKKKSQRTPRTTMETMFCSNLTTPGMPFVAALRWRTGEQQQHQTHQGTVAGRATMEPRVPGALHQHEEQTTGQSVQAPNVNSLLLDKMLKVVVRVIQQIVTESNGAVLEEDKIVAITKIVLTLMEKNGQENS